MKKKSLLLLLIIFTNFLCFIPNETFAYYNEKYDIQLYDVSITVNKDTTFDITENITVNFNEPSNGITRKIPIKNPIISTSKYETNSMVEITDVIVEGKKFKVSEEEGYKNIKIENEDAKLTGEQNYTIKYKYKMDKESIKSANQLYFEFNLRKWDARVKKVNFKIQMPKKVNKNSVEAEVTDFRNTEDIMHTVKGDTIIGNTYQKKYPLEKVSIKINIPEEMFKTYDFSINKKVWIVSEVCLSFILIAYVILKISQKNSKIIETVEFYPPNGYNSAEINFLYNGKVDSKGVISLLIYLANKGYLKIVEENNKKKSFKIIKVKEYDGNNKYEKMFFDGIFIETKVSDEDLEKVTKIMKEAEEYGETIEFQDAIKIVKDTGKEEKEIVSADDLYFRIYRTTREIKKEMNTKKNRNKIIKQTTMWKKLVILVMCYLIAALMLIEEYSEETIQMFIISMILFTIIIGYMTKEIKIEERYRTKRILLYSILSCILTILTMFIPLIKYSLSNLLSIIIGIISISILVKILTLIPKHNMKGLELLGKIKGFKRFLEIAEKPQLEAMVNKEPEYFYNILPYTYALEVSEEWMKKFEIFEIKTPEWYIGTSILSFAEFNIVMSNNLRNIKQKVETIGTPRRNSGGFSGGGSGRRRRKFLVIIK